MLVYGFSPTMTTPETIVSIEYFPQLVTDRPMHPELVNAKNGGFQKQVVTHWGTSLVVTNFFPLLYGPRRACRSLACERGFCPGSNWANAQRSVSQILVPHSS